MSENGNVSSPEDEIYYSVTYTCVQPGCIYGGKQNYEVLTLQAVDIAETMRCTACGGDMIKSNVVKAGGVDKEIWT